MTRSQYDEVCSRVKRGEEIHVRAATLDGQTKKARVTECIEMAGALVLEGFPAPVPYQEAELLN